jgi:hypothetical protein
MQSINWRKVFCIWLSISLGSTIVLIGIGWKSVSAFHNRSNRIINVRNFDKSLRLGIVQHFIDTRLHKHFDVLTFGDSQPQGFKFTYDKTFTYLLGKMLKSKKTYNMAIQDGRVLDTLSIVNMIKTKGYKTKIAIFCLQAGHVKEPNFRRLEERPSLFPARFLFYPRSIFVALIKELRIKNPKKFKNNWYIDPFKDIERDEYYLILQNLIISLKQIADEVILYVAPHPREAVEYLGYDYSYFEKFYNRANDICKSNDVKCLYFSDSFKKDNFVDLVHLNETGHKKLADILYAQIRCHFN